MNFEEFLKTLTKSEVFSLVKELTLSRKDAEHLALAINELKHRK